MSAALDAPNDRDLVREVKFRHPNEFSLLLKAASLRQEGNTNEEILATLEAETEKK